MALVTKNFTLNVTPGAMPPIVHVSEYDIGRAFNVTLIGENRNAFEIPNGTTATVEGTLNGTVGFTTSATISNNQITFALTESMTAYAGRAWCKIKLTLNSEPIQTCAFVLAVDRAGVEADTVIGADGFYNQIAAAVDAWLEVNAQNGIPSVVKTALLDCFEHVAWIDDQGQDYYDALHDALYPQVLSSISAVFTQGSAVIYDTDSLDTLKQYLTVTAHYSDSTTETVTNYTLSGTLTEGTSVITVSYGGKTTTFNVTVTHLVNPYSDVNSWLLNTAIYIPSTGQEYSDIQATVDGVSILKDLVQLTSGVTYTVKCDSPYIFYLIMCDDDGIYREIIGRPDDTTQYNEITFTAGNYRKMSISLKSPSTATAQDITAANVSVSSQSLSWDLNKAIYNNRTGEPFADIQADYTGVMLLQSFLPVALSTTYTLNVATGYFVRAYLISESGIYLRNFTPSGNVSGSDEAKYMSISVGRTDQAAITDADKTNCALEIDAKPIA